MSMIKVEDGRVVITFDVQEAIALLSQARLAAPEGFRSTDAVPPLNLIQRAMWYPDEGPALVDAINQLMAGDAA